jgi:uncharacterized protein YceH (UPF0502 family)
MSQERGWWHEERVALDEALIPEELRVLGCLMEKEAATPDYYPLTLNSLVTACNQSSNRDPVVDYDPATVTDALDSLRAKKLTRIVHSPSGRAPKFKHVLDEALGLDSAARALLTVMMLRGPQTLGELRIRTERLHPFESTSEIEPELERLGTAEPPFVVRLERQPGQKEARYAHLLAGMPDPSTISSGPSAGRETPSGSGLSARVEALEQQVTMLTQQLAELREQLGA